MPITDLTQAEMSLATERLLDEQLGHLEATPYLSHLIGPLRDLTQAFVDDERDPQAELRAAVEQLHARVARFDDQIRALDHFMHGFRLLADDPGLRDAIEAAHGEVLPAGRQLVNRSAGDKAAEGRLMAGRIDRDTAELLDALRLGDRSLLDVVQRDLYAASEAVADAQAERLELEASTGTRTRGFNLATRRAFVQLDGALRTLLDIHRADETERAALLGFTDRLVAQAERRVAGRRSPDAAAPAAADGVDPSAEAAAPAPDAAAGVDPAPDPQPPSAPAVDDAPDADDARGPIQPIRL